MNNDEDMKQILKFLQLLAMLLGRHYSPQCTCGTCEFQTYVRARTGASVKVQNG